MLVFVVLTAALVASCYGQVGYAQTTTSQPANPGVESEDEPQIPQVVYRGPTVRRTNVLATQVRQNPPPPVRGIPQEESFKPYSFNYVAQGEDGTSTREETADGNGRVVGSYTLAVEDGRRRTVQYVADADGFRANVETNEPGTDSQNPADVVFYSSLSGTPARGAGNPVNVDVQRPPTTRSRIPQRRPLASYTHHAPSSHNHHQHPQAVHYDDRYGGDYVVYGRPLPYYYGDYQSHHY